MKPVEGLHAAGWHAALELDFAADNGRTWIARKRHSGPLVVQRPFYPEGEKICQTVLVHPPGGIAGGDELEIAITVGRSACVQLTTPGAGKWYRGFGRPARQVVRIRVGDSAACEWLPQENIVFDGALADMVLEVELAPGGVFCGWDFTCLGRPSSRERFASGRLRQRVAVLRECKPLFHERAYIDALDVNVAEISGLGGHCSYGTMFLAGRPVADDVLAAAREVVDDDEHAGVTRMGEMLVARWVGDSMESGRALFTRLWTVLRPWYLGRAAVLPRIWNT